MQERRGKQIGLGIGERVEGGGGKTGSVSIFVKCSFFEAMCCAVHSGAECSELDTKRRKGESYVLLGRSNKNETIHAAGSPKKDHEEKHFTVGVPVSCRYGPDEKYGTIPGAGTIQKSA